MVPCREVLVTACWDVACRPAPLVYAVPTLSAQTETTGLRLNKEPWLSNAFETASRHSQCCLLR
jgi:hypothetical protein